MRNLTLWVASEIQSLRDTYECTHEEALEHIRDMLEEGQDCYDELTGNEKREVLKLVKR